MKDTLDSALHTTETPVTAKTPKILVVLNKPVGDTILSVPLLRNLRLNYPHARMDVLASPRGQGILVHCPYIDTLLTPDKGGTLYWQLLKNRFDLAFICQRFPKYSVISKLAGIKTVISYRYQEIKKGAKHTPWALGVDKPIDIPGKEPHMVEQLLSFMTPLGIPVHNTHLELWPTPEDEHSIDTLLGETQQPLAVLHVATESAHKHVDIACFTQAAQALHQNGFQILCTGLAQDQSVIEALGKQAGVSLTNLAGKTNLGQLIALLKRSKVLISIDSSPIHIAAAIQTPYIIGLYGSERAIRIWHPYNPDCQFHPVVYPDYPPSELGQHLGELIQTLILPHYFEHNQPCLS